MLPDLDDCLVLLFLVELLLFTLLLDLLVVDVLFLVELTPLLVADPVVLDLRLVTEFEP